MSDELIYIGSHGNFKRLKEVATGEVQEVVHAETVASVRRNTIAAYRTGITAVDKLAVPGTPTTADVTTGGSLAFNTAYNVAVAAYNSSGVTTVSTVASRTTANDAANTHVVRVTVPTVSGATGYDLFLSTAAAPLYVARVTAAQVAGGGCRVTAVGTVDTAGANAAGTVDIQAVGTGVASNSTTFGFNNAMVFTGLPSINCAGYTTLSVIVKITCTDMRTAPSVAPTVYMGNAATLEYHQISANSLTILGSTTTPTSQLTHISTTVTGATDIVVALTILTGQGASVDLYYQLC